MLDDYVTRTLRSIGAQQDWTAAGRALVNLASPYLHTVNPEIFSD